MVIVSWIRKIVREEIKKALEEEALIKNQITNVNFKADALPYTHVATKSNIDTPWECDECNKAFKTQHGYNIHFSLSGRHHGKGYMAKMTQEERDAHMKKMRNANLHIGGKDNGRV